MMRHLPGLSRFVGRMEGMIGSEFTSLFVVWIAAAVCRHQRRSVSILAEKEWPVMLRVNPVND